MSLPTPEPPAYNYYLLEPGGTLWNRVADFEADRQHRIDQQETIVKVLGADAALTSGGQLLGLIFTPPKAGPRGMRLQAGTCDWYPNQRSARGRELFARFADIFVPGWSDFTRHMGGQLIPGLGERGERVFRNSHWEKVGEHTILVIPCDAHGKPGWTPDPEVRPLRISKYWRLRELAGLA